MAAVSRVKHWRESKGFQVVILADLEETELGTYLADIYHEAANEKHSSVVKLD